MPPLIVVPRVRLKAPDNVNFPAPCFSNPPAVGNEEPETVPENSVSPTWLTISFASPVFKGPEPLNPPETEELISTGPHGYVGVELQSHAMAPFELIETPVLEDRVRPDPSKNSPPTLALI